MHVHYVQHELNISYIWTSSLYQQDAPIHFNGSRYDLNCAIDRIVLVKLGLPAFGVICFDVLNRVGVQSPFEHVGMRLIRPALSQTSQNEVQKFIPFTQQSPATQRWIHS